MSNSHRFLIQNRWLIKFFLTQQNKMNFTSSPAIRLKYTILPFKDWIAYLWSENVCFYMQRANAFRIKCMR